MSTRGTHDGFIADLLGRTRALQEGVATGKHEVSGAIQVEVELVDGALVWCDVVMSLGGARGALVRLPKQGDTGLIALCDGDTARAFWLGYAASESASPSPQIEPDSYAMIAPSGEAIKIRASNAAVMIESGAASVTLQSGEVELKTQGAKLKLSALGEVELSNASGAKLSLSAASFVDLGNNAASLVDVVRELLLAVSTGTVATPIGPQLLVSPLWPSITAKLLLLKPPAI